jgi:hypothetical protein
MLFEELLEEIAGFAAMGFLVGDDDELLRKRRGSSLSWIATAWDAEELSRPISKPKKASNSTARIRAVAGAPGAFAATAKGDLDDAFRKLGSISYASTGAKTRGAAETNGVLSQTRLASMPRLPPMALPTIWKMRSRGGAVAVEVEVVVRKAC